MRYNNYHKHTHESNISTIDCVVKSIDYMKRAIELNHTTYFSTEHGWTGKYMLNYDLSNKYGLKFIYSVEAYIVKDRFINDKGNYHIIIVALNRFGFNQLNTILSQASMTGFYYKPRIDLSLLLSLNKDDFIITSACIGGIGRADFNDLILPIHNHFGSNFYLEIQSHNNIKQIEFNKKILQLSIDSNISLIHANDSHYIDSHDIKYRDYLLKGKNMNYDDELDFILDYPDYDTILERYCKQEVIPKDLAKQALDNTLIFDNCDDLNFNKEIKMPKFPCKDTKAELKKVINKRFKNIKTSLPKEKYIEAIKFETDIILKTNMENYFLWNEKIIEVGKNDFGLVLSRTGRGSCVSFYVNKILGFTEIDRLVSPITLYPTRFMSIERILSTKSLPDIDFNCADVEPVLLASKKVLGENGIYQMIALGTMQQSEAFRNLCRALDLKVSDYDHVAKNIDQYRDHEDWKDIIKDSERFIGVIDKVSPAPSAYLLLDKDISEEIGLVRVNNVICCNMDGETAETFKYLKNDYLKVKVWKVISDSFKEINKPIPTIEELLKLCDDKVWKLYSDGITSTLNQVDTESSTQLVKQYKPQNIAELSAFVASIRPGFASLVNKFLNRIEHTTGEIEVDKILDDSYHYMIYQESIMKFLIWCGIEESQTYDIIKKISKKKFKEQELIDLKAQLMNEYIKKVGNNDKFNELWQIIEDAASYSFNASHSLSVALDSLYGAYLKSNYPLQYYKCALNVFNDNTIKINNIFDEMSYFNIQLGDINFRNCCNEYSYNIETNTIFRSLQSIKGFGEKLDIVNQLNQINKNKYKDFTELLNDLVCLDIPKSKLEILINLNFFNEFGNIEYLLNVFNTFIQFYSIKEIFKSKTIDINIDWEKHFEKSTDKKYTKIKDNLELIKDICKQYKDSKLDIKLILDNEYKYYDQCISKFNIKNNNLYYIKKIVTKSSNYILNCYNIKTGENKEFRLKKYLLENYFKSKSTYYNYKLNSQIIIEIKEYRDIPRKILVEEKFVELETKDSYIQKFIIKGV